MIEYNIFKKVGYCYFFIDNWILMNQLLRQVKEGIEYKVSTPEGLRDFERRYQMAVAEIDAVTARYVARVEFGR